MIDYSQMIEAARQTLGEGPAWGTKKGWEVDGGGWIDFDMATVLLGKGLVQIRVGKRQSVACKYMVWTGPDEAPAEPQRFALGDVVQLKSGGLAMTVISSGCGETYECAWLPAITADMPSDVHGDLPCFYIPGAALKPFVDVDDDIPF